MHFYADRKIQTVYNDSPDNKSLKKENKKNSLEYRETKNGFNGMGLQQLL